MTDASHFTSREILYLIQVPWSRSMESTEIFSVYSVKDLLWWYSNVSGV